MSLLLQAIGVGVSGFLFLLLFGAPLDSILLSSHSNDFR